jgi:hypothetical protein
MKAILTLRAVSGSFFPIGCSGADEITFGGPRSATIETSTIQIR